MEDKIRAILSDILEVEPGKIGENFSHESCASWDSLSNLRILSALEKEFQVNFSWAEISSMTDFGHIRAVVRGRLEAAGAAGRTK